MDITAHIRELLFGHDCVIVPGFGGFIGNYTPARIEKTSGTFYPPVKQISFNRNLNHNDGLLIGKISTSSGLNYGDARNVTDQFVGDITRRLAKGEKVLFDHIGSFTTNHEGNLQFEPDRDANYYLNSYGLTSFQFMPLEGYDTRKRISRISADEPEKQTSLRKYLWRAAVIVPLVGILIAVPLTTNLFRTKVESTSLNPLAAVEFENNRISVTGDTKPGNSLPAANTAPAEDKALNDPSEQVGKAGNAGSNIPSESYYIITGSFQSESNAGLLMKRLLDEGYSPELIKGPNGFFRVCALKCSNLSEAVQKKDSVGRKYPGTWVARMN